MRRRVLIGVSFAVLLLTVWVQAQEPSDEPGPGETLPYTRIYADAGGASHFADEKQVLAPVNFGPNIPPTPASTPTAATGLVFICAPPGAFADWHRAPRRQFMVILAGEIEGEVSDGEVRQFGPGSVILVEDTEGQGHRTRVIGKERACVAGVSLAEK